jgi:hypothetical protein
MRMNDDDFNFDVISPIIFVSVVIGFLVFMIKTTGNPTPPSKIEKNVPTREELKKIDQKQNFAVIDGVIYHY